MAQIWNNLQLNNAKSIADVRASALEWYRTNYQNWLMWYLILFYFFFLHWCYYQQVFNYLCNFTNQKIYSEQQPFENRTYIRKTQSKLLKRIKREIVHSANCSIVKLDLIIFIIRVRCHYIIIFQIFFFCFGVFNTWQSLIYPFTIEFWLNCTWFGELLEMVS